MDKEAKNPHDMRLLHVNSNRTALTVPRTKPNEGDTHEVVRYGFLHLPDFALERAEIHSHYFVVTSMKFIEQANEMKEAEKNMN